MAQPPPPNPAAELIAQLRDAKTPLARVRVVVRAWRAVRSLSPRDRSDLITRLGLEGADDLVEAIAAHQGTKPPAELIQAVNQMNRLDPQALRSVATRMRDPDQRGAVIKEGLKTLETKLAGPEPGQPPLPGPPPGPPAGFTTARPPAPPPAPVVVMPATSWPLREATPSPPPQPAPVRQAAPAPAPAPAVKTEPVAAPVAPVVVAAPLPAPERPKPVPAPAPEPATAVRGSLADELAAVPVLTSRFRLLRRRLSALRQLSLGELRGVLEVFADGWARRRALAEILEAGIPGRTADALALVDTLQSPGDRSWCLGTLVDSRTLSSEEKSVLLDAAPTPAGRRRLSQRLDKA